MNNKGIELIVAYCLKSKGMGQNGHLPWKLVRDLRHFAQLTQYVPESESGKRNAVVMGRKTRDSIRRPLPGRLNVVLSKQKLSFDDEDTITSNDFYNVLDSLAENEQIHKIFIIGGSEIYRMALRLGRCTYIHATEIFNDFDCDVFFPELDFSKIVEQSVSAVEIEGTIAYKFVTYKCIATPIQIKNNYEEYQYLNLVRETIDHGIERSDRTGTGTLALFGKQMRFSLRDDVFPLLTTKRVFWKGVAKELLWFVRGHTNSNLLKDDQIHIWDGNSSREYLDSIGLTNNEEGDLGPIYGFQWRHFGATYVGMHADYTNTGIDQLKGVIDTIRRQPHSRRLVVSAWNPVALNEMALPPCHIFYQFFVANGELSCQMYQRSCDLGLGVPFNIASYALLTRLVAQVCGLKAGDFIHVLGDVHVYKNHVNALEEQLKRVPTPFPKLRINPSITDIDTFQFDDFTLEQYNPQKPIPMQMAV